MIRFPTKLHTLRLGLLESDDGDANLLGKPARLLNHTNGDKERTEADDLLVFECG
jgi:hypothetical protein